MILAPLDGFSQSKEFKDKVDKMAIQIEELKTEVVVLQRNIQSMQGTFNTTTGKLNTLIDQIADNISQIKSAQTSVSTTTIDTSKQMSNMGERITATNERMERLSEQFAQLRKIIEDIPKQPSIVSPSNAEQLYSGAYTDYSRGNYDLALSEFQQYVDQYQTSELADNAQFMIGEIYLAQNKPSEAATAFGKVAQISPNGDKAPSALFKRATILKDTGNKSQAVAEFVNIVRNYPRSSESAYATQELQQLDPNALQTISRPSTPPKGGRKPQR